VARAFEINIYGGFDNILNQSYSSIVSLNATSFGGGSAPYFNPSPTRSAYGGFTLKYLL
jgi:iron complex outermembrane receptor protein